MSVFVFAGNCLKCRLPDKDFAIVKHTQSFRVRNLIGDVGHVFILPWIGCLQDCCVGLLFALLPVLAGENGILQGLISMSRE